MANEADTQQLMLQIDASVELLRRRLAEGDTAVDRFEQSVAATARRVDDSIGRMGGRFGAFAELARSAADRTRQSFEQSFTEIQRLAARAVQAPTLEGGALNLDVDGARAAAQAAERQAEALRQIEAAAIRAGGATREQSEATRLYIAAANAARIEAERNAQQLNQQVGTLERLQAELVQTAGGQRIVDSSYRATGVSVGQLRAGTQQLSFQVGDVAASFASGTPVVQIFAQQIGQTVQAVQLMTNATSGFLGFLAGPWGAVLTGAVTILATLALNSNKAADAKRDQAKASDELRDAVQRLTGASATLSRATRQGIVDDINRANSLRLRAIEARKAAIAELELARERLSANRAQAGRFGGGDGGRAAAAGSAALATGDERAIAQLEARITEQNAKISQNSLAIRSGNAQLILRDVAAGTDAATAATQRYDDALNVLQRRFERGQINGDQFRQQAERLTRERDAALEIAQASGGGGRGRGGRGGRSGGSSSVDRAEQEFANRFASFEARVARNGQLEAFAKELGDTLTAPVVEGASEWFKAYADSAERIVQITDDLVEQEARQREDAIYRNADLFETLFSRGTRGLWQEFEREGLRVVALIVARLFAGQSLGSAIGSVGGIGSQVGDGVNALFRLFGGGRARGGRVAPGSWYMVGEQGPEPFIPDVPGTIVPNSVFRSSRSSPVVVQLAVDEGAMFVPRVQQISGEVSVQVVDRNNSAVARARRREIPQ